MKDQTFDNNKRFRNIKFTSKHSVFVILYGAFPDDKLHSQDISKVVGANLFLLPILLTFLKALTMKMKAISVANNSSVYL